MKSIALALSLFLTSIVASYAQDCKDLKSEKDSFTGLEVKSIRADFDNPYYQATLVKSGESIVMKNVMVIPAVIDRPILPTDTLLMALENGHILKLVPDKRYDGVYRAGAYAMTTFTPSYLVSMESLQELAGSIIKKIRFTLTTTGDIPVREKRAKKFMEAAKCML